MILWNEVILPSDKEWFIPQGEKAYVMCAAVVERDKFVFVLQFDGEEHSLIDEYSRLYRYDNGRWLAMDVGANIRAIVPWQEDDWKEAGIAVLSRDARVWFIGDDIREEKIPGSPGFTYGMSKQIGEIFVYGAYGQFYRRKKDQWIQDDFGMRDVTFNEEGNEATLNSVVTPDGHNYYACGSYSARDYVMFVRSHGSNWKSIRIDDNDTRLDQIMFCAMLAESSGNVWITTDEGLLLNGDIKNGFKVVVDVEDREFFTMIAEFRGVVYVGGNNATYKINADKKLEAMAVPPYRNLRGKLKNNSGGGFLIASDDFLWAIGSSGMRRYDGNSWENIDMPAISK